MIEATELLGLRVSADGKCLRLQVRDKNGEALSLSLPVCWLNAMLDALPRTTGVDTIHALDSWSMDRLNNGQDLVLTLRAPEGQSVSFAMKPWQVEGMATIATYGTSDRSSQNTVH
jgi:hypothetical protein